jgi:Tfp pilus assembly protein PilV
MISIGLLSLSLLIASDAISAATVSSAQWQALNSSVGGRLGQGTPMTLPCFTEYNGLAVSNEQSACASIEVNGTNPIYRSEIFGAFMQVIAS